MAQELKNFNIILTGGTGALGKVITTEFIKSGASVITNFRSEPKFDDLKQTVTTKEKLHGIQVDLDSEKNVQSYFEQASTRFKRLDVFIHIMGGFWMGEEIADTSLENWNRMMNLNLTSAFLCTREAFKIMKVQCSGKIFTVGAKTAEEFPPKMGAYTVSKAGVLALTRILANEGKAYNILVNSILPGIIDTQANRKDMPEADFSEWVTPEQISRVLIYLCKAETQILSHSFLKLFGKL
jgi:NAD(P)-dependent dehydrogenase (short-subunit alcohol dehydrogenase family)